MNSLDYFDGNIPDNLHGAWPSGIDGLEGCWDIQLVVRGDI
jgi:hypothetical protein